MQFNQGGLLVAEPNLFESTSGHAIDPNQHHGHVYESNIERYLQRRRKWLWRKAIYTSWICASNRWKCNNRSEQAMLPKSTTKRVSDDMTLSARSKTNNTLVVV